MILNGFLFLSINLPLILKVQVRDSVHLVLQDFLIGRFCNAEHLSNVRTFEPLVRSLSRLRK